MARRGRRGDRGAGQGPVSRRYWIVQDPEFQERGPQFTFAMALFNGSTWPLIARQAIIKTGLVAEMRTLWLFSVAIIS
jgi:hypothetical protein